MPTHVIFTDGSDGYIYSVSATYSTARSGAGLTKISTSPDPGYLFDSVGQYFGGGNYYCYEAFLSFDTSVVVNKVLSVTLAMYLDTGNDGSTTDFTANVRAYDWGTPPLTTTDWVAGASLSNNPLRATLASSGVSTAAYNSFTSDSSFVDNTANPVRLLISSSRHEGNNTPTGAEYLDFYSYDKSTTTYAPKLTIVTDDPAVFATMQPRIPAEAR